MWLLEHLRPQAPQLLGSSAKLPSLQAPALPARAQDWQAPVQAWLQQTPWTQKPVAHSPPERQAWPLFFWQVPSAEQVWSPRHESASSPEVTLAQVPPAPVQASHAPHAGRVQQ
jgi:hypothetical protein